MVTVLCVGLASLGKSEQVWSTNFPQPWVPRSSNLAHPQTCVQFPNRTSLETTTLRSRGIRSSSCFSWRKLWTGVKCNFSSPHHHVRKIVGKLSNRRVGMWNVTRRGPKTKKLWLSIFPVQRQSEHPSLGPRQKGVNCNFSWPEFNKPYGVRKLSISDAWIWSFSRIAQKIKKLQLSFIAWKLRKISLDWALWCGSRRIDNFSLLRQWKAVT